MAYTISLTQSQEVTVLKAFLQVITGIDPKYVVQGQANRIPAPTATDNIVFTPILRERLNTNVVGYNSSTGTILDTRTDTQYTKLTVQIDVFGPNSADNVQVISTAMRSDLATDYFANSGLPVTPLYVSDPRQSPFLDESSQIQMRWNLDAVLEVQPSISGTQQFADSLAVGVKEVDAFFPPA
jgi:hypothetical protein